MRRAALWWSLDAWRLTLSAIPGMRVIVSSLLDAFADLGNVMLLLAFVLGLRLQRSMLWLQELRPTHAWHRHAWHRQLLLLVRLLVRLLRRLPQRGCGREARRSSRSSREVAAAAQHGVLPALLQVAGRRREARHARTDRRRRRSRLLGWKRRQRRQAAVHRRCRRRPAGARRSRCGDAGERAVFQHQAEHLEYAVLRQTVHARRHIDTTREVAAAQPVQLHQ